MGDPIRDNGVVGCGGAGFPAAVKLRAAAGTVIVNAAECEPLLHKDREILVHHADLVLRGLSIAMKRVGASEGVIGIKRKHAKLVSSLEKRLPSKVRICLLRDTYPSGDEFVLVYDVTGKVIPPGGLPLDVGCVVCNVETLHNIGLDAPVTHKFLTVAGAVKHPVTLRVPVGTPLRELLPAAGGSTERDFALLVGGVMMGRLGDLDEPVTKTTGGVIVLPVDHPLVARYSRTEKHVVRIGRSACDQCTFCTELCPRYLLGHPIEPHRAMRALGFPTGQDPLIVGTLYCCECNLCSLISCPEGLDPKNVCVMDRAIVREKGLKWTGDARKPHPLLADRRTPTRKLFSRLALTAFADEGELRDGGIDPSRVVLPLRQHLGAAASPVVTSGDRVRTGDLVAEAPEGKLGARIHASIDGTVREVNGAVVIERSRRR